jgi:hypothetical protein
MLGIFFIFRETRPELPNVSSAGSLRAGQRVERTVRVGITVSHRRKERARRLASRFCSPLVVRDASSCGKILCPCLQNV